MDDKEHLGNKTFGKNPNNLKSKDFDRPIKKCHSLDGKFFIVIDKTITDKLNFSDVENTEIYYQQEVTEDNCILLRPFKLRT